MSDEAAAAPATSARELHDFSEGAPLSQTIVLESSEGLLLKVNKTRLSQMSPVFADMLEFRPSSTDGDEKPLRLAESILVLLILIGASMQKPIFDFVPSERVGSLLVDAVKAAEKYDMKLVGAWLEREMA